MIFKKVDFRREIKWSATNWNIFLKTVSFILWEILVRKIYLQRLRYIDRWETERSHYCDFLLRLDNWFRFYKYEGLNFSAQEKHRGLFKLSRDWKELRKFVRKVTITRCWSFARECLHSVYIYKQRSRNTAKKYMMNKCYVSMLSLLSSNTERIVLLFLYLHARITHRWLIGKLRQIWFCRKQWLTSRNVRVLIYS